MRNVFRGLIGPVIVACVSLPTPQAAVASPDGEKSTSNTTFYEVALMCPAAAGLDAECDRGNERAHGHDVVVASSIDSASNDGCGDA